MIRAVPRVSPWIGLLLLLAVALQPAPASAEVRGGSFQLGAVAGVASFGDRLGLKPCPWFGGYAGHRFQPLAERLYLGFRAGWEGCVTAQRVTDARIDMILVDVAFTYGIRVTDWLMPYGLSGGGFLVADSTPSGGKPFPRTLFHGGGGVVATIGPYLEVDVGVRILVHENIQFGGVQGQVGTVASPLLFIQVGAQI